MALLKVLLVGLLMARPGRSSSSSNSAVSSFRINETELQLGMENFPWKDACSSKDNDLMQADPASWNSHGAPQGSTSSGRSLVRQRYSQSNYLISTGNHITGGPLVSFRSPTLIIPLLAQMLPLVRKLLSPLAT